MLLSGLTCPGRVDPLYRHLAPGSGRRSAVHHAVAWLEKSEPVVHLQQLEGAPAAEVVGVGGFDVRVSELPQHPALLCRGFTPQLLHQEDGGVDIPPLTRPPHCFDRGRSCVPWGEVRMRGSTSPLWSNGITVRNTCMSPHVYKLLLAWKCVI